MKNLFVCKICIILFFLFTYHVCSSQQHEDSMPFLSLSNDRLHMDGVDYMCLKSPLSTFDNFIKIYPPCHSFVEDRDKSEINDKNYKVSWSVKDSFLYLCNIIPLCLSGNRLKHMYAQIEKLTGNQFKMPDDISDYVSAGEKGVMCATWFTDSLYIRRCFDSKCESYDMYMKTSSPFLVIVKNGHIIQITRVKTIPIKEYMDAFMKIRGIHSLPEELQKVMINDLKNSNEE